MLNRDTIRQNPEWVKKKLTLRRFDASLVDRYLAIDTLRRDTIQKVETLNQKRNEISREIGRRKKQKDTADDLLNDMTQIKFTLETLYHHQKELNEQEEELLMTFPNLPHDSVPCGVSETANEEVSRVGEIPDFAFDPKPHEEIGEQLELFDFRRGAKVTGSRFAFLKGAGSKLERALIQFMLDQQTEQNGYTEYSPPFIVNRDSLKGTGQLPKFEEDLLKLAETDYFLIPTAEVPLTNLHRNEILDSSLLPLNYTAHSACFRSEAGSAGRDTKGLIRQHQFQKIELVKFVKPEDSYEELERITRDAESILELLKLPYRRVLLCTGDMGFGSAKTYDLEVWFPSQNKYREISSATNFEDFQARRANIRFRREDRVKPEYVHTLNASGLAVGRCLAAILENYQQEDGRVKIPDALVPYMNGRTFL